jgi:hypothetical protein
MDQLLAMQTNNDLSVEQLFQQLSEVESKKPVGEDSGEKSVEPVKEELTPKTGVKINAGNESGDSEEGFTVVKRKGKKTINVKEISNEKPFSSAVKSNLKSDNISTATLVIETVLEKKTYVEKETVDGARYEFMFNPQVLKYIQEKQKTYITCDLFSNQYSKQCDDYYHFDKENKDARFDAFKKDWSKGVVWVNYPFRYLMNILKKIKTDNAEALVLIHKSRDYEYTPMLQTMFDWEYELPITDDLFLIADKNGLWQPKPAHLPQNAKYSIVHIPKVETKSPSFKKEDFPDISMNQTITLKSGSDSKSGGKSESIVTEVIATPVVATQVVKEKAVKKKTVVKFTNRSVIDEEFDQARLEELKENDDISMEVNRYIEISEKITELKKQITKLEKNKSRYNEMIKEFY